MALQVDLSWTDNSPYEEGFKIYRSTNGGAFTLLDTVAAGVTSYTDTTVSKGNHYVYYVVSYRGDLTSDESNDAGTVLAIDTAALSDRVPKSVSVQQIDALGLQEAGQSATAKGLLDQAVLNDGGTIHPTVSLSSPIGLGEIAWPAWEAIRRPQEVLALDEQPSRHTGRATMEPLPLSDLLAKGPTVYLGEAYSLAELLTRQATIAKADALAFTVLLNRRASKAISSILGLNEVARRGIYFTIESIFNLAAQLLREADLSLSVSESIGLSDGSLANPAVTLAETLGLTPALRRAGEFGRALVGALALMDRTAGATQHLVDSLLGFEEVITQLEKTRYRALAEMLALEEGLTERRLELERSVQSMLALQVEGMRALESSRSLEDALTFLTSIGFGYSYRLADQLALLALTRFALTHPLEDTDVLPLIEQLAKVRDSRRRLMDGLPLDDLVRRTTAKVSLSEIPLFDGEQVLAKRIIKVVLELSSFIKRKRASLTRRLGEVCGLSERLRREAERVLTDLIALAIQAEMLSEYRRGLSEALDLYDGANVASLLPLRDVLALQTLADRQGELHRSLSDELLETERLSKAARHLLLSSITLVEANRFGLGKSFASSLDLQGQRSSEIAHRMEDSLQLLLKFNQHRPIYLADLLALGDLARKATERLLGETLSLEDRLLREALTALVDQLTWSEQCASALERLSWDWLLLSDGSSVSSSLLMGEILSLGEEAPRLLERALAPETILLQELLERIFILEPQSTLALKESIFRTGLFDRSLEELLELWETPGLAEVGPLAELVLEVLKQRLARISLD